MSLPMISNLSNQLAQKLDIQGSGQDLVSALKATAFKGNVNDSQMIALLVIANQYGLNPWTKEIYAFPQSGGIVPIVGVDGWLRIINSHPQFDGMEFEQDDEKCTCTIYRKDRTRPTSVTEYLSECKRNTDPWKQHAKRMLRHKAMMQCARYAFGLALNDHDDANDILQDVFMKAWLNIENFRGDAKLSTWLYKIAINESITFINRSKAKLNLSIDDDDSFLVNKLEGDEYFDGDSAQLLLQKAVVRLPQKQRLVFQMKYYNELKYDEISEILGTSVGALKASYHHAVKKVEKFIKESNATIAKNPLINLSLDKINIVVLKVNIIFIYTPI